MDRAGIFARHSAYLDRYVQVGLAQGKVIAVSFPMEADDDAESEHDLLDRIEAYLDGEDDDFEDVAIGLTVPTEHRAVLETVQSIPHGESVSTRQVARMTPTLDPDDEDDHETIREALADNPVPLFTPDHRVRDAPSAAPPGVEQKLRSVEGL